LAGIGITELTDAICLVVSEEKGSISFVVEGKVEEGLLAEEMIDRLNAAFSHEMVSMGD
jgi:DNA integrity scanning protein DisA with diadenylate cyclase activity